MIRHLRTALAAAALGTLAIGTWAADAPAASTEPVTAPLTTDQREVKQDTRIEDGVAKGQVTKHEAKRLNMEQKGIARAQKHAEADGKVSRKEQNRLDNLQNKASKDIKRQRHDKANRE